jgi:hypothetical protein
MTVHPCGRVGKEERVDIPLHRVLIVSPHFPPINAPDHHRVRMSLPHFEEFGWQPTVLSVKPDYVEGIRDPMLRQMVPDSVSVVGTKALNLRQARRFGLGNLGLRAIPYLRRAGTRIIEREQINLVYFSTTVFPSISLGPMWRRRTGVPFVLDFQDPWLSDYYETAASDPPGGKFKYGVSRKIAQALEPRAMRHMSHAISVSPAYPQMLLARYPWLNPSQFTVLPFGAAETDFESVAAFDLKQGVFNPNDGKRHWVYVGRGGKDMAKALRILFLTVKQERERRPESFRSVKMHFVGTDYAPAERAVKTVEPIARECGVADLVEEQTERIPYFKALKILMDSDAILLFGSDDPGYTASKLYPCILARKPVLAVFHEQSTVVEILRRCNAGRSVTFSNANHTAHTLGQAASHLHWLLSLPKGYEPETDWEEFRPYTAREMTRRQCEIFDRCLEARTCSQS